MLVLGTRKNPGPSSRPPGVWRAPLLQLEAPLHDLVQLSRSPSLVVGLGVLNLEHVRSLTGPATNLAWGSRSRVRSVVCVSRRVCHADL
jgi:hypothetical protein